MPEISNPQYWQEQEQKANKIRPILERTFALAQQYGWIEPTSDECWQYQGDKHTLVYDPDSDALWIEANDSDWRINFHEQAFVPEPDTQITQAQLQDFQALQDYLEQQDIAGDTDLRTVQQQAQQHWNQVHAVTEDDRASLASTAEQLFEYYASQGEAAYKLSPESTEYFYQVAVEDKVYIVSRDDKIGSYNLQREGTRLDLSIGQGVTQENVKTWTDIEAWIAEYQRLTNKDIQASKNGWEETYWSQQEDRANTLLAIAEAIFTHQEDKGEVHLDEARQAYVTTVSNYEVGYSTHTDTLWVQRDDTVLVSASGHNQNSNAEEWWQLEGLSDLGEIRLQDIDYFRSLAAWLQAKEHPIEHEPGIIEQTRLGMTVDPVQLPTIGSRLEDSNPNHPLTEEAVEAAISGIEAIDKQADIFGNEDNFPIDYEERE